MKKNSVISLWGIAVAMALVFSACFFVPADDWEVLASADNGSGGNGSGDGSSSGGEEPQGEASVTLVNNSGYVIRDPQFYTEDDDSFKCTALIPHEQSETFTIPVGTYSKIQGDAEVYRYYFIYDKSFTLTAGQTKTIILTIDNIRYGYH